MTTNAPCTYLFVFDDKYINIIDFFCGRNRNEVLQRQVVGHISSMTFTQQRSKEMPYKLHGSF